MPKYPRFYAINDRPIAVVETPAGAPECLVFDFVSGNLIVDRSYLAELTGGGEGDHEELTQQQFAHLVGERRVEVLQIWAERLCRAASGSAEDLLTAIGAAMKPAPLGANEIRVRGGEIGMANIELDLPPNTVTKGELDVTLGECREVPRPGEGAAHAVVYDVEDPGSPNRCSVFASFNDAPKENSSVKTVMLRVDKA
jgi:hypothetical protein